MRRARALPSDRAPRPFARAPRQIHMQSQTLHRPPLAAAAAARVGARRGIGSVGGRTPVTCQANSATSLHLRCRGVARLGGDGSGGGSGESGRRRKWRTPTPRAAGTSAVPSVPQPPPPEPSTLAIVPLFADNNNTGGLSVLDELIASRGYDPLAIDEYFRMHPLELAARAAKVTGALATLGFLSARKDYKKLVEAIEKLGPTYVKFGQALASRWGPGKYCNRLSKPLNSIHERPKCVG